MPTDKAWERIPRNLKMRELRVLLAVAEHGSFRKAGAALHVTQPAITKAIADTESLLGVRLFDRSAQGVTATVEGRSFIRHAAAIFGELRSAAEELEIIASGSQGSLHVGTVPMPAAGVLPVAIRALTQGPQRIFVSAIEGTEAALAEGLRRRELDVMFSRYAEFGPGEDLSFDTLFEDAICIIAGIAHPLASRRRVTWRELLREPWVLPPANSYFRHHIQRVLNKEGLEMPRHAIETTSIHIMYGMIAHAPMLTFATRTQYAFSPLRRELAQLRIALPPVTASIGAVTLRGRHPNPLTAQLVAQVRALAAKV
jgi:DNA-binding transcriptional LysR family regulator